MNVMHSAILLAAALPVCFAEPRRPQSDAEVIERLPRGLSIIARKERTPSLSLAREYILLAQTHGETRYASVAESILSRIDGSSVEARFLRGVVDQYLHRFADSEKAFREVLSADPGHSEALLQMAMLHVVQGRFQNARELLARNPQIMGSPRGLGMLTVAAGLSGQLDASFALLQKQGAAFTGTSAERAWLKATLAEMELRRGHLEKAEAFLIEARFLQPESVPLLVQWADLLLEQGRFAEVATLAQSHFAHTGLLLRAAAAMTHLAGRERQLQALRGELQVRLFDSTGGRHLREQAFFALRLLNDPRRALAIALENFETQREPIDARLALESAVRAGAAAEAAPVLAWLRETKLEDSAIAKAVIQLGARL